MATRGRQRTFQKGSQLEEKMVLILRSMKLDYKRNFRKCIPGRSLEADFYLDRYNIAIHIQGGTWIGFGKNDTKVGWHNHPIGYKKDCDKHNQFTLHGYYQLYYTVDHFSNIQDIISTIKGLVTRVTNQEENAKQLSFA